MDFTANPEPVFLLLSINVVVQVTAACRPEGASSEPSPPCCVRLSAEGKQQHQ